MFSIREILTEPAPIIRVVDAGAAAYENDPFARLSEQGMCEVIGFEPNAENCARRNAGALPGHRYLPYALGDGRLRRFHQCQNPLTSSLYRPNAAMLDKFSQIVLPVVAEYDIQTHRLDDLSEVQDIDYLKLDVQGMELNVLRGAERTLRATRIVEAELSAVELYEGQPLIGEVIEHLCGAGYVPIGLETSFRDRATGDLLQVNGLFRERNG